MSFQFEAAKIQHFGLTEKEKCKKLSYNPIKKCSYSSTDGISSTIKGTALPPMLTMPVKAGCEVMAVTDKRKRVARCQTLGGLEEGRAARSYSLSPCLRRIYCLRNLGV
jgi:hypothetical protein